MVPVLEDESSLTGVRLFLRFLRLFAAKPGPFGSPTWRRSRGDAAILYEVVLPNRQDVIEATRLTRTQWLDEDQHSIHPGYVGDNRSPG